MLLSMLGKTLFLILFLEFSRNSGRSPPLLVVVFSFLKSCFVSEDGGAAFLFAVGLHS